MKTAIWTGLIALGLSLGACGGGSAGTPPAIGGSAGPVTPIPPVDPVASVLTPVSNYGANPGQLNMYVYKPQGLTDNRPLVVILPGCGGRAAEYDVETGWAKWAEERKFVLIIPETTSQISGCFRYYDAAHQLRGAGEPESIMEMVNWVRTKYHTDSARIFVTGFSAGGAMTNVMLAAYPEMFAAGAPIAGIPYKCAETGGAAGGCVNGFITLAPQAWGDRVRSANPAYAGPWPRVSIWQGNADVAVSPVNAVETMKQWTNVHGEDQVADVSDTVAGYPHRIYGAGKVETFDITGMGHTIPVDPGEGAEQCGAGGPTSDVNICSTYYIVRWFGLDQ